MFSYCCLKRCGSSAGSIRMVYRKQRSLLQEFRALFSQLFAFTINHRLPSDRFACGTENQATPRFKQNVLFFWNKDYSLFKTNRCSASRKPIGYVKQPSFLIYNFFEIKRINFSFVSSSTSSCAAHSNCHNQLSVCFWQKIFSLYWTKLAKMTKNTKNDLWRTKKNVRGKSDWSVSIKNQSPNQIRIIIEKKKESSARRNLNLSWDVLTFRRITKSSCFISFRLIISMHQPSSSLLTRIFPLHVRNVRRSNSGEENVPIDIALIAFALFLFLSILLIW